MTTSATLHDDLTRIDDVQDGRALTRAMRAYVRAKADLRLARAALEAAVRAHHDRASGSSEAKINSAVTPGKPAF